MNNNDTNNLNGTVLGNVDDGQNMNYNSMPIDNNIETLDSGIVNDSGVMPTQEVTPMPQAQSTFFSNPPINDMIDSNVMGNQDVTNPTSQIQLNEVQPTVEPAPAYTNPQFITPNPMPGFESSGTIGTTPPISLEPEKKPKKKSNKIIFIIIILIALAGVGFGTYYVLNYTDLLKEKEKVTIDTKNLELNIGDSLSLNITDYATISGTDSRNCSLNTSKVDINTVGIYEYVITCGEITKNGKIVIADNKELIVETKKVYKSKGDTLEAKEFAKVVDENLTYEFVEPETINNLLNGEAGSYPIKIKVISKSNKTIEVESTLVILQYKIRGYYTCTSKEQNVTDLSASMTVSEKFAIVNDGKNGYGNIAFEIYTFKFSDETEYTNYLAFYRTNNNVTINNITGDPSFDDANLTITITNEKANELVMSEYGEANMEKFSTIREYFVNTLGYSCAYKVND